MLLRTFASLLLLVAAAMAQIGTSSLDPRWQTRGVGPLASRPSSCRANRDVYICNGTGCSTNGSYYYCTAANTWTLGGGGSSGYTSTTTGSTSTIDFTCTSGSVLCADFNYAALMTRANTWLGLNDFSGGRFRFPETAFASLPTASTVTGQVFRVTDCATAACTAGSGTVTSLRVSTGSAYQTLGDGAAASTTAHLEYYPMASYNSNSSTGSWGGWSGGSQGFSDFAGLGGNQKMYGAAFNANTTTSMTYSTILPDTWDGNSVPVKVYASNSSGLTGTAYVTISSMCPTLSASSQQMNQSYTFSNSVSMSQVITSTYGRFVMSGTLPMTGCSAGSPVLYQVSRTGNNGTTDTMNSPLYVFGMSVSITY